VTKQYPSKQYLSEVISNREFAESVPPEIVIVMARQLLAGMEQEPKEKAAVATLESHGFSWSGGQLWRPPLGLPPAFVSNDRAELQRFRDAAPQLP